MAMADPLSRLCTAFEGFQQITQGPLVGVALAVAIALSANPSASILIFDDETGRVIDLDLRGTHSEIVARLGPTSDQPPCSQDDGGGKERSANRGRGRPRLGVVAREVTLLPRHWQWLATQRGGASAALRRLVDEARRADAGRTHARTSQERAYRFVAALAGNLAGFEEAGRALFAGERQRFEHHTASWPPDVRSYAQRLAWTISTAMEGAEAVL